MGGTRDFRSAVGGVEADGEGAGIRGGRESGNGIVDVGGL